MTNPVKGLNPLKKVSWTIWNLDANGKVTTWLGTIDRQSTKEIAESHDADLLTVSPDVDAIDNIYGDRIMHGLAVKSSAGKPFLIYVPNVPSALVKE